MKLNQDKMLSALLELKEKFHATGIKLEFEAEGANLEDAIFLKKISKKLGLNFSLKIGGCEAIKDLREIKSIGVNSIIAPMVESAYAVKKYVRAINSVFNESEKSKIKFLINIETKTGFENLEEIFKLKEFKEVSGVVFGRHDFISSYDLDVAEIENEFMLNCTKKIASKTHKYRKEFILGGAISKKTVDFLKKTGSDLIDKFETRKVIFNSELIDCENLQRAIEKAIEFEILYLKNNSSANIKRIEYLSNLL